MGETNVMGETAVMRTATFYTGPIPEPADLMAWEDGALQDLMAPPEFPDDYDAPDFEEKAAEYQKRVEDYMAVHAEYGQKLMGDQGRTFADRIDELVAQTRTGDKAAVAAWQSLLVASGIAVNSGGGIVEVNGMSGGGIPMTPSELRLHTLLGTTSSGLPLTSFADMLEELGFDASVRDGRTLVDDLYEDLSTLSSSDYAFGRVMHALNPNMLTSFRFGVPHLVPANEVMLTGAQTGLLLRRIAAQAAHKADQQGIPVARLLENLRQQMPAPGDAAVGTVKAAATAGSLCGQDDSFLVETIHKGRNTLGGKAFGALFSRFSITVENVHGFLGAAVGTAGLIVNFFQLQAEPSLVNAPLIRTKDREPGEQRELRLRFTLPEQGGELVRCLQNTFARLGFDLGRKEGAMSGIDVDVNRLGERVQFARGGPGGTATYRQKTDGNGVAVFPIEGRAQKGRFPPGAAPEAVTSTMRYSANLEGADLWKGLRDAAADAAGGVPNMIAGTLSRMNLAVFAWEIPVRDWTLDAEFEMTLTGVFHQHYGVYTWRRGTGGHCPDSTVNRSDSGSGTIKSQPHRVTVRHLTVEDESGGPIGGTLIHTKGLELHEIQTYSRNGGELAHLDVSYTIEMREDKPGIEPMPEQEFHHNEHHCADGLGLPPPQPDCGTRDFRGIATMNILDGTIHITADTPVGTPWKHCGWQNVPAPPRELTSCKNATRTGGVLPSLDTIYNQNNKAFTISGTLACNSGGVGSLRRFSFDWQLDFCRIVDGVRAC